MTIEVGGASRFQPVSSNTGEQVFNANGNITASSNADVKKVEQIATDSKTKEARGSQTGFEVKTLANNGANRERIQKILDDINASMYSYNKELHFSVNENTKDLVVKIVNGKTGEVVQQYPAQEIVDMREKLLEGNTVGLSLES